MHLNIHRILVPTDFSESSESVLAFATSLAKDNNATLVIAHAIAPHGAPTAAPVAPGVPVAPPPAYDRDDMRKQLEQVRPVGEQVRYEHRLVEGLPSTAIIELIKQENIDLVVMGTHGRTGLMRLLMGSVAEAVVRRATCPVLTLRPPAVE